MVDGTKIQKMSVSQNIICLNYEKYYRCLTILFPKPQFFDWSPPLVLLCFVINNIDKNLSGKSDEREVKICKNGLFTLHSSFFILWKVSFHTSKGKLWRGQSLCFIASNMVFHTTKPYLSRTKTLLLTNLYFVNRPFTVLNPCNHLSANMLRKTSKIDVFSTEWPFRTRRCP